MSRVRPNTYLLVALTLLVVLIGRHWPQDPDKAAWRAANRHFARGEFAQAVDQFDRVLEIRPDFARALFYRGIALFYSGRYRESAASMDAGLAVGGDPYMLFWRYLARARGEGGQAGREDLRRGLRERGLEPGGWPGILGAALLGEASEEDVVAKVREAVTGDRRGQAAEALFYLGQRHLLDDETPEAMALFARAVNTGASNYLEYLGAAEELRRRGAPPAVR